MQQKKKIEILRNKYKIIIKIMFHFFIFLCSILTIPIKSTISMITFAKVRATQSNRKFYDFITILSHVKPQLKSNKTIGHYEFQFKLNMQTQFQTLNYGKFKILVFIIENITCLICGVFFEYYLPISSLLHK